MIRRLAIACAALVLAGPALAEDRDQAIKEASERIAALQKEVEEKPADATARKNLANAHTKIGSIYLKLNKVQEAEASHRSALAQLEKIAMVNPADADLRNDLAGAHDG